MRPPRMGAPTIPTRERVRSRHGVAPCGSGVDQPRSISTSDDARINMVKAQSDHASRVSERSLITLLATRRREPEGDVGRLHRLSDDAGHLGCQAVQVGGVAQAGAELLESLGRIVLPSVKATVYEILDAVT